LGSPAGPKILYEWIQRGFDLGNHTYSHPDFNELTVAQFEDEIVRGEKTFTPLMKAAGRSSKVFRFPFNHTGDTQEKHDAVAAFLKDRGYMTAPCTIDDEDWLFNATYFRANARHDEATAAKVRNAFLAYAAAEIDYYTALNKQVLGYEPPHIMLIHDNPLNADVIDDLLALFEKRGYRFVTLAQAEMDPVYQAPEKDITKFGPMWGYRWARERNISVKGNNEPEPPKWIEEYGKK
jgi:peptidoglycan/xylan/chitin deacetylase (PgdA/CDA1 family)